MPDRPCSTFYEFVGRLATAIVEVWQWVPTFVKWCGASNPCIWYCLCCNVWGCWIIGVILALVATILLVIFIVLAAIMVVICWIVCLIYALWIAINSRGPDAVEPPNCFAGHYEPIPPPEPPPPAPPVERPPHHRDHDPPPPFGEGPPDDH